MRPSCCSCGCHPGAEDTSVLRLLSRVLPRPRPPAPCGPLPHAVLERSTQLAPPTARRWRRGLSLDNRNQSEAVAGAGTRRPLFPPESGSGSDARDRWGAIMVPLGRGEAAAAAVAGSRGGKSRNWTQLVLGLLGGRGIWTPCLRRSR